MVTPRNEPTAPPSTGKKSQVGRSWLLLLVLAIIIIAAIAWVANRPGAGMGGSLSREGGTTPPAADRSP